MKKVGVILARFQPIHNGHIELIKKATSENDYVLVIIGSIDKLNERNPIPWNIRKELVVESLQDVTNVYIMELPDLSNEDDNSHDWGFYLYSKIIQKIGQHNFTIYYSDGYEIITSWFPGFILRDSISLSLLARNSVESGVSATKVRSLLLRYKESKEIENELKQIVPECVFNMRHQLNAFLQIFNKHF